MSFFTGKNVSSSQVGSLPGQSGMGYTFANKGNEYEAALEFTGGTEHGAHPFDTFKPVDPASMNWENPGSKSKK